MDLTLETFSFQGIKANALDATNINYIDGLYSWEALKAYKPIYMFFQAGADGGLAVGLACNPAFLDDKQGQRIANTLQAGSLKTPTLWPQSNIFFARVMKCD